MEKSEILENISNSIANRLKVPIVVTYICVLIIYNWDILFYLFFEKIPASQRISTIKDLYGDVYFERIAICLLLAIILIILFTILNTLLNLILKWFYRKDKETNTEIENHEKISSLAEQLSESIEENKNLNANIQHLNTVNDNLTSKNIDVNLDEISKKDYNALIHYLKSQPEKEKLIYSLKELIIALKKDINIEKQHMDKKTTYEYAMKSLIIILENRKLLKITEEYSNSKNKWTTEFRLSRSFKDFLKMDIN